MAKSSPPGSVSGRYRPRPVRALPAKNPCAARIFPFTGGHIPDQGMFIGDFADAARGGDSLSGVSPRPEGQTESLSASSLYDRGSVGEASWRAILSLAASSRYRAAVTRQIAHRQTAIPMTGMAISSINRRSRGRGSRGLRCCGWQGGRRPIRRSPQRNYQNGGGRQPLLFL